MCLSFASVQQFSTLGGEHVQYCKSGNFGQCNIFGKQKKIPFCTKVLRTLLGLRLLECTCGDRVHQSSSRSWRWLCIECGVRILVCRSVHAVPESCRCCRGCGRANFYKGRSIRETESGRSSGEFYYRCFKF